ncbi:MAG: DUF1963 domain-containing protein [Oscillibacter sp.]|nr:DUF1963 domain-containing protein [Oscillibacter sp.]
MTERLDVEQVLKALARNSIRLEPGEGNGPVVGRFGGLPDVPPEFVWPVFETAVYNDSTVKPRPLSFLAQFDCAALAPLDMDGLLPHTGVLSFFYELDSQRWGYDPEDTGCARVYWFPDKAALVPAADFPEEMEDYLRLPSTPFQAKSEITYPDFEDFALPYPEITHPSYWKQVYGGWEGFLGKYDTVSAALRGREPETFHKLLGWPDIIQNNMTRECELVCQGFHTGGSWDKIPIETRQEAARTSLDGWRLLFQMDTVTIGDEFELMFGDNGSIYFYIRKEDLAACRFDRIWLILQCF